MTLGGADKKQGTVMQSQNNSAYQYLCTILNLHLKLDEPEFSNYTSGIADGEFQAKFRVESSQGSYYCNTESFYETFRQSRPLVPSFPFEFIIVILYNASEGCLQCNLQWYIIMLQFGKNSSRVFISMRQWPIAYYFSLLYSC